MLVQMWFLKTLWLWFEVNVFRKWNRSILKCREWLQRVSSVSWSPHCFCLTFLSETALSSAWSVCFSVAGKGHRNCLFLIWVVQTGFIFYDSGNELVWVYIDFWACSPSPITHSLFTIKFKHCIPPFSSAVLSSAPGQCGCSTRTEVLQRRQCQECLREVRQSQAQGCGCRQCWGVSHRSLQSLLLFRCVFYKPDLLLPPDCGASALCLCPDYEEHTWALQHQQSHGILQTAHKHFSLSCPKLREAGSLIILFPCIFPLLSYFLLPPHYIFLLSVIHWQLFYCAFLF